MPLSFCPNKLVELNMSSSHIERLWKETTHDLEMLTSINLTKCLHLSQIPNLKRASNLEKLILEDCIGLSKVHPSIGELKQLVLLSLKGCESLKSLPQGINLESLETFILSGCKKLTKFPEIVGNMDRLSELYLDGTAIKELPISIEHLSGLILLNLRDCKSILKLPNELCRLTSLKNLDISGCSLVEQLPENIGHLEQLENLSAGRTAIRKVPPSLVLLKKLKALCFCECGGVAYTSCWSVFSCCLLPRDESIHFQLPNSLFSHLISLRSLCLRKCNLRENAIPEDIGCLSSLKLLDLSENSFAILPESISQLFNLRNLHLNGCERLESLPKLPLSVQHVFAHGCPILKNSNSQISIWTSDRGLTVINYDTPDEDASADLPFFGEHNEMIFSKQLEDNIYNGEIPLKYDFICTRIPEWCSEKNNRSSIRIQLPLEDNGKTWIGFAIFAVFIIQEGGILNENGKLENAYFSFETDKADLGNEQFVLDHSRITRTGSYGVCIYVPQAKFAEQLNKASHVAASISTENSHIMADKCGIHIVFNKDVPDFSRRLSQIISESMMFKYKCGRKRIKATKFETSKCDEEIQSNQHKQIKRESYRSSTESDSARKTRRDLEWLVPILIQRCYAHNYGFAFNFHLKAIPTWFFHHSVAPFTVCYLPMNLFDEKPWVGFCLYVLLTWPNDSLDLETPSELDFEFQAHGDGGEISRINYTISIKHKLLLLNIPRVYFKFIPNQCRAVSAMFRTKIQNLEIEMCGIRLVSEQDLKTVVQMIADITLSSYPHHFCYEEFGKFPEDSSSAVEFTVPKVEIPIDFDYYERDSLKEFLSSTKRICHFSFTSKEKVERPHFESSYQIIPACTPKDSSPVFINLQIVAENALKVCDPIKWQKGIEETLKRLIGFDVVITLILQGHIISVFKPFNPFSNYNLCFPRKEILDWFEGYKVRKRNMEITLPPNLSADHNWRGIAVCVSFSVHEHPTAIRDYKILQHAFGLRCHLNTEEYCFHPPMFHTNKFKFIWLHIRGFIWLTYIPSYEFAGHLNGQSILEINIFNECPGVAITNLGARFLYQQDVEELTQSIAKCRSSIFDNLDPIRQTMAHQHCECYFHFDHDCSLHYLAGIAAYCGFENENPSLAAKTESIYPRKTGVDFDRGMIYDSCFPPTEILDWFRLHSTGSSLTIQLPPSLYGDGNWIGLALCAYFSDLQHQEIPHRLTCQMKTEKVGLESQHEFQITNEELKKLNSGEFIWMSYIPRRWFSDRLKHCSLIEASFESDRQKLSAYKCGARLLYQHDEEEFKQTINHCMASFSDSISDRFTQQASTRKTGRTLKQTEAEDKGKRTQQ
nr:uncharacterized protein LOC112493411 [Ziziphus jujuba var. spinosa]